MFGHHNMTFGDLGQLFDGPHATPKRMDSGPYFLNISSLNAGRLDLDQSDHVSEDDFLHWTRRVTPQENDLLFSYETRLGEAALMPGGVQACLGRRMALMRPNCEVVHPRFLLYYYLSPSFQQLIEQHTIHGATVNRIGLSTMGNWPISIPPLDEQRAIAEVLGALDDKIAANTKLAETAATLAITSLAPFKAQTTQLQNLVSYKKVTIDPATVSAATVAHYSLPAFDVNESPEIASPSAIKSSKFSIEEPSVLISKLNPRFPRVWDVLNVPEIPALASTEFLVLEPVSTSTSVLWAILTQADFGMRLESKVAGTSGSHQRVKPADLLATEAVNGDAIPLGVQQSITSLGASIAVIRHENQTLAATRDALLPQLMSGKLRVKDIEHTMGEMV